ncbi:MAG: hypothetical protein ABI837_16075 [Acidobacteriota bacterium]
MVTSPMFPDATERIHWSFDDPTVATTGTDEQRLRAFVLVRDMIQQRLRMFITIATRK